MPEDVITKPPMPTDKIPSSYFNDCVGVNEIIIRDILKRLEVLEGK